MSKLIVKWLEWIIEIGIWLFLIAAFIGGLQVGNGFFGSLVSGVISVVFGGVLCALIFGLFIVLNDIRGMLKSALEQNTGPTS